MCVAPGETLERFRFLLPRLDSDAEKLKGFPYIKDTVLETRIYRDENSWSKIDIARVLNPHSALFDERSPSAIVHESP